MPRNSKRRYKKKNSSRNALTKAQYNAVKKLDTKLEFKRSPMLRAQKNWDGWIRENAGPPKTRNDITKNSSLIQAPFQDIPVQVVSGTALDQNQRLGSMIYPQVLKFSGTLLSAVARTQPQRFRISVIRYTGESDMDITNSDLNGFALGDFVHTCRPGELFSMKPFVKNQIRVLYDKEYVVNDENKNGVVVKLSVPIKRKMTFETTNQGSNAVGAGNIYIMITSDADWNLYNYKTYAFYKDLQ